MRRAKEKMTEKRKDHQELQLKIDQYADMLFKLSFLKLQNVQDAEDVVQEVFYQYVKRQDNFEGDEHEKAWLIKVTLNACRKVWHSAWNRHRCQTGDGEAGRELLNAGGFSQESAAGPEESIVDQEERQMLLRAVRELPVRYREVIHLFYYEELSVREIAGVTGRKESTVTSQLTRGRVLLKKRLKEEYDFA